VAAGANQRTGGGRRAAVGRPEEMGKEKETNRYLCNQWHVGNFGIQKQVKAGPPAAIKNELHKSFF
jgi:hypothetical protein